MSLFLTIALIHLIALASPGPDFFFVSQTAVSRSRRQALAGVVGISLGVMVWAALALLGLQLLLHRLVWLQRAMTLAGGLYLIWMGARVLLSVWRRDPAARTAVIVENSAWKTLRAGLYTNLANPKAVVYFGSVFSAFLGDQVSGPMRWALWLLVTGETFAWFALVAGLFALPAMRRGYLRAAHWIDGFAGVVFVLFGLRLVLGRKV